MHLETVKVNNSAIIALWKSCLLKKKLGFKPIKCVFYRYLTIVFFYNSYAPKTKDLESLMSVRISPQINKI